MRGKAHLIPRLDNRQPVDSDLHFPPSAGYAYGTPLTQPAAYQAHLQETPLDAQNQAVTSAGYQQYLPSSPHLLQQQQPQILGYSQDSLHGIERQDAAPYSHGSLLPSRQQLDLSGPSGAGMTPYSPDGYPTSGLPHGSMPVSSLPMMGGIMQQPRMPSGIPSRKPKTESKPMIDPIDNKQLCTFFMRTGTCAYGDRCRYKHPKDRPPPQLNSRGFPLREGEPDCEHYIKRGWCAFGVTCKFNHPESTAFMHMPYQQPSFVPMPGLVTMPYMPYSYPAYSSTGMPAPSAVYPHGSYSPQSPIMNMSPMGMPRPDLSLQHAGDSGGQSAGIDKAAQSLEALTLRGQASK